MSSVEYRESFLMALGAIRTHKLRSALTLLGVLVGVFSIIVVMTAIRVMQTSIESQLGQLGSSSFQIQRWPGLQVGGGIRDWEKYRRRKDLTYDQAMDLKEKLTLARSVGMDEGFWTAEVVSRNEKTNPDVRLRGVTPGAFPAKNWIIAQGRGIIDSDIESNRRICVLGHAVAERLFPQYSGLNETIKFHGVNYTVVGVLESKGAALGGDQDNFVLIPLTTGLNRYGWRRSLDILVQAPDQATYDDTLQQARGVLRALRKVPPGAEDDFEIISNDSLITQFRAITLAARLGAGIISSIALLVAGIGIMNIMLVSVTERTREIGIRRAIGAKRNSILAQFIIEAVVLCQIGGLAGIALGVAGGNVAAVALKVTPNIPLDWIVFGLLLCSAVGVIFGTYPAYKAANLDPIEALRYE